MKRMTWVLVAMAIGLSAAGLYAGSQKESASAPVVIKYYTDSDDSINKLRMAPEFIAEFEKRNPGIKVELQSLVGTYDSEAYNKKADVMIAAGEQIDLLGESTLDRVYAKVRAGVLEPLNEYAKREGIDLAKEYKGIIPIDGKVYMIPENVATWLVYINKDMLDAAGLPLPPRDWTWADYREYAKKLTRGEGATKVYGSYFHTWDWFYAIGMQATIMDKPYFKRDGSHNFDNPVFREGMQYRWDLENVDKSQVPFAEIKSQKYAYRDVFFSGKAAMLPMGAWMVADIKNTEKFPHTFKTTFATFPRWSTSDKPNTTTADGAGSGWGINAASKHKEEAYKFLRFFTSEGWEYAHSMWSAWNKSDAQATVIGMGGPNESLYDAAALRSIVFDPAKVWNSYTFVGPGEPEVLDAYIQENEKFLLGGQTLDQTLANVKKRADEIIARSR